MGFAGIQISGGSPISPDDTPLYIGTGNPSSISWVTTDANAKHMMVELPAGGAVNVPVVLFGQGIRGNDLGVYNGIVETTVAIWSNRASATPAEVQFRKSRGSASAPTVITTGDDLGRVSAFGYSGAGGYVESARIEFDSAGTIATTRVGGTIRLRTATDAAPSVLTTGLVVDEAQQVIVSGSLFFNTPVSAPSAATDQVRLTQTDFAAGDARLYVQAESGGTLVLGNNTIRQLTSDLTLSTAAATTDIVLAPARAVAINSGATVAASADRIALFSVDIAAGDARLGVQAESGGILYLGNNTIRQQTSDLTIQTIATGTDLILTPIRAVVVSQGATRVAVADQVSYFTVDIAAGDSRIGFQSEAGSIIYLGNDILRFAASTGIIGIGATTVLSLTTTAVALGTLNLTMTGTIAATGSRVTQSYHTNITSTNAVTVDSWGMSKQGWVAYTADALSIIVGIEVGSFWHNLDRDRSGRVKLGVKAESIQEPLALVEADYGYGLGVGPTLDTMGLATLHTRAIQQLADDNLLFQRIAEYLKTSPVARERLRHIMASV